MEATARYQLLLAEAAFRKALPLCIVKPLSVRRYAQAIGLLVRTDRIDAKVIAEFGSKVQPPITLRKSKSLMLIKDLLSRRQAPNTRRTLQCENNALHGDSQRHFMQPNNQRVLSTTNSPG